METIRSLGNRTLAAPVRPLAAFALAFLALPSEGPLVGARVNHRLAPGQDVSLSTLSPDGKRLFYVVTEPGFDEGQLWVVPIDGSGAALPLTDPLPPGADFRRVEVSADGHWLAYTADQDAPGQTELYGMPTDGSEAPTKLNAPLLPSGDVYPLIRFAGNGLRVVFIAENKLYSVPADGSQAAVQISSGSIVGTFEISPDGSRVVYIGNQEAFSVPTDGSAAPTQLSGSPVDEQPLTEYQISPDGAYVVYRAWTFDLSGEATYWIFSAPIGGSEPPALLFDPIYEGLFPANPTIRISPDSSFVVHRSDPDSLGTDQYMMESAPIDGSGAAVTLNPPYGPGGGLAPDFRFTADGRVVFGYAPGNGVGRGIYVVPVDGGAAPQRITDTAVPPTPMKWEMSPLGRVLFVGYSGTTYELYTVPLDGSAPPVRLSADMVAGGNIANGNSINGPSFRISPSGKVAMYVADQEVDGVWEWYVVPVDGSAPVRKVNRRLAAGGSLSQFPGSFTPDSRRVLYSADQRADEVYEVWVTTLDGFTTDPAVPLPPGQPVVR